MAMQTFFEFCSTLEAISIAKSKQKKQQIVGEFVSRYPRGAAFYDVLRLFLPDWERERGPYRLGEPTFTKTLTNILCLPPTGSDLHLLRNFNQSTSGEASKCNDYADAAYAVVRKKTNSNRARSYSIAEINVQLDAIAAGNVRRQEDVIHNLFRSLSHVEIKWLIRILLRQVKLGLGRSDILLSYHPDAARYFSTCNSLQQMCVDLVDRNRAASDVELRVFNAFRPMLSLRCNVKEFNRVGAGMEEVEEYFVEEKFDGERFQLHFARGECRYFSRNGFDFTDAFRAHALRIEGHLNATSVILDGEMMIYFKTTGTFGSKGMHADIKRVKPDASIQQCFCVFDVVYHNGRNLCRLPLRDRKQLLQAVIKPIEGVLVISDWKSVYSVQGLLDELNSSMDRKQEGIVFKAVDSAYLPGERLGWWKVKLEYFEGVMSDLDVLIVGGYYGHGASKGEMVAYLVAVKETRETRFFSFAKLSIGLNRDELRLLNNELRPHWQEVPPANVIKGKEVPDRWITPRKSRCLLVRATELVRQYDTTKSYATAYTLRFPRIVALRLDKPFDECLTTSELDALTEGAASTVCKLNKRHLDLSDLNPPRGKRRRAMRFTSGRLPVDVVSDILVGRTFVVLSGLGEWTVELVVKAIRENGGAVAIECTNDTLCMLVGDEHIRTTTYRGDVDIVRLEWLRNVLNEGEFTMYEPSDIVYMSEKSRRHFTQEFDAFGDAYTQPADRNSLKKIFLNYIKNERHVMHATVEEIDEFHAEIHFERGWKPLRGFVAYFDRFKIINDESSARLCRHLDDIDAELIEFRIAGGQQSEFLTEGCDCIIAANARFEELQAYLRPLRWDIPIHSSIEDFKQHLQQRESSS